MSLIRTTILGICIVMAIGLYCNMAHKATDRPQEAITVVKRGIMSIRELQTFLNEKGHSRYACKVDGKMGKETQRAWDNWICDRHYKESTYE